MPTAPSESPLKNRGGRPKKTQPGIFERIADHYAGGVPLRLAAEAEGVSESTVHEWQERNSGFRSLLARARAKRTAEYAVELHQNRDPGQMRWWLSRVVPEFADRRSVELSGPDGGPIAVLTGVVDLGAQIRANPAAFAEHAALLKGAGSVRAHEPGGVGDDGDGGDAAAVAPGAAPAAPQPRARRRRAG